MLTLFYSIAVLIVQGFLCTLIMFAVYLSHLHIGDHTYDIRYTGVVAMYVSKFLKYLNLK